MSRTYKDRKYKQRTIEKIIRDDNRIDRLFYLKKKEKILKDNFKKEKFNETKSFIA